MTLKERLISMRVGVAVIGAFVSAGGICLTIGGLLLSEYDLTGLGFGMIVGGTLTYVTLLNWVARDES
jgi:hypothetical protein